MAVLYDLGKHLRASGFRGLGFREPGMAWESGKPQPEAFHNLQDPEPETGDFNVNPLFLSPQAALP